ncbi:hypothetical protein CRV01_09205 [Arcobacter sp. CECT 8983]|uniref:hypothetical protein n=1 Tax=Arcobacter sp. CECT 8983 TaxID=2044508 RepID=UPI00100AC045|nr:hypothetical protein [Arcobacter sp. CECT 8983]RXJ88792.1 hypothetical protein CRV01_09205 [Arcobacter sp. CECT 8983]
MSLEKTFLRNIKKTTNQLKNLPLHKMDNDYKTLKKAFDIAYENELFSFHKYSIKNPELLKFRLFRKITPYSGSLSFLAIQILAANSIMTKNDFKRKEHFFNKKCGISINHLRDNKTVINAKKCKDGYKLNGHLTWASGYKIFDKLLIGFHYDNKEYEAIASFKKKKGFNILETPETFVGYSLNTVNIKLDDFFIKEENIVSSHEIGHYTKNKSLSKTIHYALYGIALGAMKNIDNEKLKKESKKRINKLKDTFIKTENPAYLDQIRIDLFTTIQDIITTAMILNGGKSILIDKNLQRFYREIIMFNSNGLNSHIKSLFLEKFI